MAELSYRKSVWLALLVTFLWSTSWQLIKIGLKDVPPLTFAGLRYMLAFLCLLPFFLRFSGGQILPNMDRRAWLQMLGLGIIFYTLAQGAQYVRLASLPAVQTGRAPFLKHRKSLFYIPLYVKKWIL